MSSIKSNHIPIILIQPQLLLLFGGMNIPKNDIVEVDRICFIHIKEEAIYIMEGDEVSMSKRKKDNNAFLHSASKVSFG